MAASDAGASSKAAPIYIAGHGGMVGNALLRRLRAAGYSQLVTRSRAELNLLDQQAVKAFLAAERPAYVFVAAARVGGIQANRANPADFIYDNLVIAANLIHGAHLAGVQRLMFLASSAMYPRDATQPMCEDDLLGGPLDPSNEPYAIAKIAGVKLAQAYAAQHRRQYISVVPTNLYGPNDHYEPARSHVLPALLLRAHEAKVRGDHELVVWGNGDARREFLHVDDLADACVHLMELNYDGPPVNIGCGEDLPIRELAELVAGVVGYRGHIIFDASKPNGTPRKLLDCGRLQSLGWRPRVRLHEGMQETYRDFLARRSPIPRATTTLPHDSNG